MAAALCRLGMFEASLMSKLAVNTSAGFDRVNLHAFSTFGAVNYFTALTGWLDPGERALIEAAAAGMDRPRVLDIGVGGGRTVPMMQAIAGDYLAIDMAPRLIEVCRRLHPGTDVREMDARAMSLGDDAFDLVTFSYNGLDAVPLPDRDQVLAEVARVTRAGGVFAFSSLNRDGPGFAERFALATPRPGRPRLMEAARMVAKAGVGYYNYRKNQRYRTDGRDFAVSISSAHNYGVVAIFASLTAQVAALIRHGFVVEQVFSNLDGASLPLDRNDSDAIWLHYLARRAK